MCGCVWCSRPNFDKISNSPLTKKKLPLEANSSLHPNVTSSAELFPPSVTIDDFQQLRLLGKGSFGKVILVKYYENDKIYAMKILKKEDIIKRKQIEHIKTERFLLEKLNHPFITKLKFAFQDEQKLYLITEFMQGGELYFHLKRNSCFKEKVVKFYMSQILLAIEYIHKNGYIYRDLKPENILIDKDGNIKLTDFGLSKILLDGIKTTNTLCGTFEYLAPEIFNGKPYTKSVDWFSFGVLLYEMICGKLPFNLKNKKYEQSVFETEIEYPEKMSQEARDTIGKLLEIEPEKRLGYNSADEIKNSEFFKNIDFNKVYNKEYKPPFKPKLNGDLDLKYFDINYLEENIDSEEFLMSNNYDRYCLGKNQKDNEENKTHIFSEFSYYNEEEKNNKNDENSDIFDF